MTKKPVRNSFLTLVNITWSCEFKSTFRQENWVTFCLRTSYLSYFSRFVIFVWTGDLMNLSNHHFICLISKRNIFYQFIFKQTNRLNSSTVKFRHFLHSTTFFRRSDERQSDVDVESSTFHSEPTAKDERNDEAARKLRTPHRWIGRKFEIRIRSFQKSESRTKWIRTNCRKCCDGAKCKDRIEKSEWISTFSDALN